MNKQVPTLRVFCLTQSLCHTEWTSLLGHKYAEALPFTVELVDELKDAQVIAWNGLVTPKLDACLAPLIERLNKDAVLLLMGEAHSLYRQHYSVKYADIAGWKVVELPSWSVLPEEILSALSRCREKLPHV